MFNHLKPTKMKNLINYLELVIAAIIMSLLIVVTIARIVTEVKLLF